MFVVCAMANTVFFYDLDAHVVIQRRDLGNGELEPDGRRKERDVSWKKVIGDRNKIEGLGNQKITLSRHDISNHKSGCDVRSC